MNCLKMLVHFGVFDCLGDEYQGVLALVFYRFLAMAVRDNTTL